MPVIRGRRERLDGPFLEHRPWNHDVLNASKNISVHLMANFAHSQLNDGQSFIIILNWVFMIDAYWTKVEKCRLPQTPHKTVLPCFPNLAHCFLNMSKYDIEVRLSSTNRICWVTAITRGTVKCRNRREVSLE